MTTVGYKRMTLHDCIKTVASMLRIEPPGKFHSTHDLLPEYSVETPEFTLEETMVEPHVMRCHHGSFNIAVQLVSDFIKRRCVFHHFIGNARQARNKRRNTDSWINQCFPALSFNSVFEAHESNLRDTVVQGRISGRFEIQEYEMRQVGKHQTLLTG